MENAKETKLVKYKNNLFTLYVVIGIRIMIRLYRMAGNFNFMTLKNVTLNSSHYVTVYHSYF